MIDFAKARRMMVDCQLRPTEVTDPDLIAAMLEIPRERFAPAALASVASPAQPAMSDPLVRN